MKDAVLKHTWRRMFETKFHQKKEFRAKSYEILKTVYAQFSAASWPSKRNFWQSIPWNLEEEDFMESTLWDKLIGPSFAGIGLSIAKPPHLEVDPSGAASSIAAETQVSFMFSRVCRKN